MWAHLRILVTQNSLIYLKMKISYLFVSLLATISFTSCDDDPLEPVPEVSGTMTCILNGTSWSAATTKGELKIVNTDDGIAKRLDIYGSNGLSSSIGLACIVEDTDLDEDIPTGTYKEDQENYITIITVSEGIAPAAVVDGFETDSGKVVVSSINAATKKCSGTFEFWAHEWAGTEITHIATSGVFTDIVYMIVE